MSSNFSIRDVILSYKSDKMHEELAGEWAAVALYRWLSFIITPLFLRTSISATGVTLISVLITITLPLAVFLPFPFTYIFIGVISIVFNILDCVDGNMARMTNSVSDLGQYSDFIADIIHRIFVYITLGLIIDNALINDISGFQAKVFTMSINLLQLAPCLENTIFQATSKKRKIWFFHLSAVLIHYCRYLLLSRVILTNCLLFYSGYFYIPVLIFSTLNSG